MELLPAFAFTLGFAIDWLLRQLAVASRHSPTSQSSARSTAQPTPILAASLACFLIANAGQMLGQGPLVYIEATRNFAARSAYTETLAAALARLHSLDPSALTLVDTSAFPTIIPRAGLTYRQTLNESDKQFFRAALAAPAQRAGIVLAFNGDAVARAVARHPQRLRLVAHFSAPGQPAASLYISTLSPLASVLPAYATQ